jgi:hypothetical protein
MATMWRRIAIAVFVTCSFVPSQAQEPAPPAPLPSAPAVVTAAALELERTLLEDDARRFDELARQRVELTQRASQAHEALDAAVARREATAPEQIARLLDQAVRADAQRESLVAALAAVAERIQDRLRRIALLSVELERAQQSPEPARSGALTGTWDLVFLPSEQRGRASLDQTGALVSGTYELAGGWTGSLQGTLVNRKVYLVRIDSRLGKSMELEGYLSSDGERIRGSWLNYELAGQEGSTGHWSAQRVTQDAR